jgi:hypothetical protein
VRHPIEKSPRDGTAIILEDDASGTSDIAHWSTEAGQWLGENSEPPEITPSHWFPLARDQCLPRDDERSRNQSWRGHARRVAVSSISVTLLATAFIATDCRAETAADVTRFVGHEDRHITEQESRLANQGSRSSFVAQQQAEADQASAPAEAQRVAQVQRISLAFVPEAQQSLKEGRTEGWAAAEPKEARRAIDGFDMQLQAEAGQSTRSLEEERERASALALEAAVARKELAASTGQNRQVLEQERARSVALERELVTVQREIETQAAQLQKAVDEAVQQKQAAESSIAELQQSLQQERGRTEAMARDLATVRRTMDGRTTVGRSADSHVHGTQAVKTTVMEPPKAADNAEAAKLIARASALLGQGNIGAARIVLERAAESGNAQASFMLAETYDPARLFAWGTYRTRGEAAKAREHYTKAHAGGIGEAKDRLDALPSERSRLQFMHR